MKLNTKLKYLCLLLNLFQYNETSFPFFFQTIFQCLTGYDTRAVIVRIIDLYAEVGVNEI